MVTPLQETAHQQSTEEGESSHVEKIEALQKYTKALGDLDNALKKYERKGLEKVETSMGWTQEGREERAIQTIRLLIDQLGSISKPNLIKFEDGSEVLYDSATGELTVGIESTQDAFLSAFGQEAPPSVDIETQQKESIKNQIDTFYKSLTSEQKEKITEFFFETIQEPEKGKEANSFLSSRITRKAPLFTFEKSEVPEIKEKQIKTGEIVETKAFFDDPKKLKIEVKKDMTLWGIVEDLFKDDEEFEGMDDGQKAYIIGHITAWIQGKAKECGLEGDGYIKAGSIIDLNPALNEK